MIAFPPRDMNALAAQYDQQGHNPLPIALLHRLRHRPLAQDDFCTICQGRENSQLKDNSYWDLPCNCHTHRQCGREWFRNESRCPTCNSDIANLMLRTAAVGTTTRQQASRQLNNVNERSAPEPTNAQIVGTTTRQQANRQPNGLNRPPAPERTTAQIIGTTTRQQASRQQNSLNQPSTAAPPAITTPTEAVLGTTTRAQARLLALNLASQPPTPAPSNLNRSRSAHLSRSRHNTPS
jgi:hypothetical protein